MPRKVRLLEAEDCLKKTEPINRFGGSELDFTHFLPFKFVYKPPDFLSFMDGCGNRGRNLLSNRDESRFTAFDQLAEFLNGLEVNFIFLPAFDLHTESLVRAGLHSFVPAVIPEPPGEQTTSFFESPSGMAGTHNYGDQSEIAALGRGYNTVASFSVGACLNAIEAAKFSDETVGIGEDEFSVPEQSVLCCSPLFGDRILQEFSSDDCHVSRARYVGGESSSWGQTVDVDVARVSHPELLGAGVHHFDKNFRVVRDMFGNCVCGIVRRADSYGLEKIYERKPLSLPQVNLLAADLGSLSRCGDDIFETDGFSLDLLEGDEKGHHLYKGCGDYLVAGLKGF